MFYIFPNIVIIFHLCLRFSRNPLCAVQDARAGDFVVKEGKSWRIPDGAEKPADGRVLSGKYVKKEEKEARKPLPIGISDYVRAQSEYYYVDKTGMIKEFLDRKPLVSLFTRPRRFGKTLKTARRILVTLVMS